MIKRDRYVIKKNTGCWEWSGAKTYNGYGRVKFKNVAWMAHRLSYTLNVGEIPEGLIVMHSCDNPSCINPEHLTVGTQKDNMEDCKAKGRLGPRGYQHNPLRVTESATERRQRQVRTALSRGWSVQSIAKYFKISPVFVRKVSQV